MRKTDDEMGGRIRGLNSVYFEYEAENYSEKGVSTRKLTVQSSNVIV
jgi:hypothetical protein